MMMRISVLPALLVCVPLAAFSQATETTTKFEVADVHNSPKGNQPSVQGPFFTDGRYELRFATMLDLIRIAYDIDPEKVSGGPTWLEMDRFDVFARAPNNSSVASRRRMLQDLLGERFKLATHNDTRPMESWALTAPKKPSLKQAEDDGKTGCNFNVENQPSGPPAPGTPIQLPTIVYTCHGTSMAAFAAEIPNIPAAGGYLNNRLVVDQTKVEGKYDFVIRFTPKVPAGIKTIGDPVTFQDALDKQLGLKLDVASVPMPTIVVDNVTQKPTPNSEEAMKSFPPLPTEFEVASVKPVAPDAASRQARPDIKNGRVYLPNISLKNLILIAWDLNGDEFIPGAPKWLEDERFDIVAKAPQGVAIGDLTPNRNGATINIEALRPMMRALITDRFNVKAHMEDRPLEAYALVSAKPKLKKSEPTARTRWQEGAIPDAKASKNANAALGRLVTCQNVSMQQFADMLPGIAPGYIHTAVIDKTGLEGGYDFTFSFSPIGALNASRGPANNNSESENPSDPVGTISLWDSVTKQLGLKLEKEQRPMPVLVIEHIDRKPTEN